MHVIYLRSGPSTCTASNLAVPLHLPIVHLSVVNSVSVRNLSPPITCAYDLLGSPDFGTV